MQNLSLKYKGDRNYLHGSDIFDEISRTIHQLDKNSWLKKLVFKSFARNQCSLSVDERPPTSEKIIGSGLWQTNEGHTKRFWVIEDARPVEQSYPFDEENLIKPATIRFNSITIDQPNEYTVIESIVALTKKINYVLSPDVEGKWVFGQIELLDTLPDHYKSIEITRLNEKAGKFSCNTIKIDGQTIGEIRFIVGAP